MNEVFTRAPHLRSPSVEQSPHAALMIDFDNVTMGIRSNLGQEIRKLLESDVIRGKVSVQRAYADWRRYPQYIVPLSEASVDLIFAPAYGSSKKNATDIRLAIDAIEIVFTRPEIGTFILLSGDSDFSSLVLKLKEYGKYVIGVGMKESSSDLLVQNCDEYYSYNSLSGLTAASDETTETFDPWVLAGRTIQRMAERKDVMRSDRFKQVMLEFDSSFSERALGFSKFNRFLSEAASRGIITLEKGANGQYEVAAGPRAEEMSKRSHSAPEPSAPARPAATRSSSSSLPPRTRCQGCSLPHRTAPSGQPLWAQSQATASPTKPPAALSPTASKTSASTSNQFPHTQGYRYDIERWPAHRTQLSAHPAAHRDRETFEGDPVHGFRLCFQGEVGLCKRPNRHREGIPICSRAGLPYLLHGVGIRIRLCGCRKRLIVVGDGCQ